MMRHRYRRAPLLALGVAAVTVVLASCSTNPATPAAKPTPTTIDGAPSTIASVIWTAPAPENAVLTEHGLLGWEKTSGGYEAQLLSALTGEPLWNSEPVDVETPPTLDLITQDGRAWAVAVAGAGAEVTVYSWDPLTGAEDAEPTQTSTFTGTADQAPQVTVSGTNVLVTGSTLGAAVIYYPDTAETTALALVVGMTAVAAEFDAFLVDDSAGSFALIGANKRWDRPAPAPEDADPVSGTVLASGSGQVISQWALPEDPEDTVIAVHEINTGRLVAEQTIPIADVADLTGSVLTTYDSVLYGQLIFDTTTGEGDTLDLRGGAPVMVRDDVVYTTDPDRAIASSAYDLIAGEIIGKPFPDVPLGLAQDGTALFLTDDGADVRAVRFKQD